MSLPSHEEALKAYIARILAVKAEQSAALSPEDLQAIALDLGLSEDDLAAGRAEAERYHQRGMGFLRHQRWAAVWLDFSTTPLRLPRRGGQIATETP